MQFSAQGRRCRTTKQRSRRIYTDVSGLYNAATALATAAMYNY